MKRVLDMSNEFSVCLGKLAVCFSVSVHIQWLPEPAESRPRSNHL